MHATASAFDCSNWRAVFSYRLKFKWNGSAVALCLSVLRHLRHGALDVSWSIDAQTAPALVEAPATAISAETRPTPVHACLAGIALVTRANAAIDGAQRLLNLLQNCVACTPSIVSSSSSSSSTTTSTSATCSPVSTSDIDVACNHSRTSSPSWRDVIEWCAFIIRRCIGGACFSAMAACRTIAHWFVEHRVHHLPAWATALVWRFLQNCWSNALTIIVAARGSSDAIDAQPGAESALPHELLSKHAGSDATIAKPQHLDSAKATKIDTTCTAPRVLPFDSNALTTGKLHLKQAVSQETHARSAETPSYAEGMEAASQAMPQQAQRQSLMPIELGSPTLYSTLSAGLRGRRTRLSTNEFAAVHSPRADASANASVRHAFKACISAEPSLSKISASLAAVVCQQEAKVHTTMSDSRFGAYTTSSPYAVEPNPPPRGLALSISVYSPSSSDASSRRPELPFDASALSAVKLRSSQSLTICSSASLASVSAVEDANAAAAAPAPATTSEPTGVAMGTAIIATRTTATATAAAAASTAEEVFRVPLPFSGDILKAVKLRTSSQTARTSESMSPFLSPPAAAKVKPVGATTPAPLTPTLPSAASYRSALLHSASRAISEALANSPLTALTPLADSSRRHLQSSTSLSSSSLSSSATALVSAKVQMSVKEAAERLGGVFSPLSSQHSRTKVVPVVMSSLAHSTPPPPPPPLPPPPPKMLDPAYCDTPVNVANELHIDAAADESPDVGFAALERAQQHITSRKRPNRKSGRCSDRFSLNMAVGHADGNKENV